MRENLGKAYWAWETNVIEKLEDLCYKWKYNFMENFVRDEEGDTNMVSMIVLIVIVIAVAAIFKDNLEKVVKGAFNKLNTFISDGL